MVEVVRGKGSVVSYLVAFVLWILLPLPWRSFIHESCSFIRLLRSLVRSPPVSYPVLQYVATTLCCCVCETLFL